jgi:hypothetical protein
MKYIKVTNKAQEVNRLKLEKLGFSTKRDDDSSIGQFGSGIKFAPISAIRKNIDFVFAGFDAKGDYVLRYIAKDDDGILSVFYKYQDYEKPSSFTAEAGILSWESPFQIYREVIANAADEARASGTEWNMEVVDVEKIIPVEGEFSVYLEATEDLLEIHNNFDKYFSFNREPLFEIDKDSRIYESIDGTFKVYSKGVLVYSSEHEVKSHGGEAKMSLFDYEIDDLELNEERTVSSHYELYRQIIRSIKYIDNPDILKDLINFFINESDSFNSYYETCIPSWVFNSYELTEESAWVNCFNEMYPNAVLMNENESSVNVLETVKLKGYNPIVIQHASILNLFKTCGLKLFNDIVKEEFIYDYKMGFADAPSLGTAVKIICDIFPDFIDAKPYIGTFVNIDNNMDLIGMSTSVDLDPESENKTKVILMSKSYCNKATIQDLVGAVIHEWDHFRTGLTDGNTEGRAFRDIADEHIGNLVVRLWMSEAKI